MPNCSRCCNWLPQEAIFCGFCGAQLAAIAALEPSSSTQADAGEPTLLQNPDRRSPASSATTTANRHQPAGQRAHWHSIAAAAAAPGSRIALPVPEPWPFLPPEIVSYQPGSKLLRLLMLIGGVAFLGIFFAPLLWSAGPPTSLRWLLGEPLNGLPFIRRSFPLAAGALLLLGGLLPVPQRLRALLSTSIGVLALVLLVAAADWRSVLLLSALILLAAGLLQKRSFPASREANPLILLGVGGILVALLLPQAGHIPLAVALSPLLGGAFALQVFKILPLFLLALALLATVAAFCRVSSGFLVAGATLALIYLPVSTLLELALAQGSGLAPPARVAPVSLVVSILLGLLLTAVGFFQLLSPRGIGLPQS